MGVGSRVYGCKSLLGGRVSGVGLRGSRSRDGGGMGRCSSEKAARMSERGSEIVLGEKERDARFACVNISRAFSPSPVEGHSARAL